MINKNTKNIPQKKKEKNKNSAHIVVDLTIENTAEDPGVWNFHNQRVHQQEPTSHTPLLGEQGLIPFSQNSMQHSMLTVPHMLCKQKGETITRFSLHHVHSIKQNECVPYKRIGLRRKGFRFLKGSNDWYHCSRCFGHLVCIQGHFGKLCIIHKRRP